MKVKLETLFFNSILFQILATQGVLFFIIFKYLGHWQLKQFLHPLSFFLVVVVFLFQAVKKVKISFVDALFFAYFFILFGLMLFQVDSIKSAYIVFREVFFLFILIFIFHQVTVKERHWDKVLNLLFYLLILNSIFMLLTTYLGPEKYMKLITGRYQWGIDPEYKFKISNFYKFWRSPALIGDAASVGYFSAISYILMDQNDVFKRKKYLALYPLIFSFVRSAYLVFLVYEFLKFFTQKKNLRILILVLKVGIPVLIATGLILARFDILSTESLVERLYLWNSNIDIAFNPIFGGAIGEIGGGARGEGFIATLDSYWLFLYYSSGIIGILLFLLFVLQKAKNNNRFLFVMIAFMLAGFFVSLTQSIVFLALFPLFFLNVKPEKHEVDA